MVADKGSEASVQRSKLRAAPRHKAVLGTASGQAAKPRELVQVLFARAYLFLCKKDLYLPTFRGDEPERESKDTALAGIYSSPA